MGITTIAWTETTWNPLRGCTAVSAGCTRCYAATLACRFNGPGQPYEGLAYRDANGKPHWTGKVRLVPEKLAEPLSWRKPRMVFVNSMSDLFHEDVPDAFIDQVFAVMAVEYEHTFQVLTKRADRMARYFAERSLGDVYTEVLKSESGEAAHAPSPLGHVRGVLRVTDMWAVRGHESRLSPPAVWPLPNVWLGVSCEDQKTADARTPHLLKVPAAVRFLSAEPLLGPIDLGHWLGRHATTEEDDCAAWCPACAVRRGSGIPLDAAIGWVICGGESGPHHRPCDPAWVASIVGQCEAAGVPCFVKQDSGARSGTQGRLSADIWAVKEFPR